MQKEYEVAVGDIIGSYIVDATLSIGIGQIFPQTVASNLAGTTIPYTIFASLAVTLILTLEEKMDKKTGTIFMMLYAIS
ncbi:hypothetical protein CW706_00680 [Candidatus Bathyarchaeota archaeon]|nr:MAG: hypothetical protein CW706_00680 [Candidatus Bathyarchaeota archaeon]